MANELVLARLRFEAELLGLTFSDEDLEAILDSLVRTRKALAESRPQANGALEPPYTFEPT